MAETLHHSCTAENISQKNLLKGKELKLSEVCQAMGVFV